MIRYAALFLGLLGWISTARDDDANPTEADYYKILTFEPSRDIVLEAGALEWMPDGKVAVSTRRGEIYMVSSPLAEDPGQQSKFVRFAHGLREVLGLAYRDG